MTRPLRIIAMACIVACSVQQAPVVYARHAPASTASASGSQIQLVRYLRQVLRPISKAVRVDYYLPYDCGPDASPPMELRRPLDGHTGVSGLREIFGAYRNLVIEQQPKLIRVDIGIPPNAILSTPIKSTEFTDLARYNAFLAIATILHKNSVRDAIRRANLILLPRMLVGPVSPAELGLPHLSRRLHSVTLGEALDRVAITFKGVVVYSICRTERGNGAVQAYFRPFK